MPTGPSHLVPTTQPFTMDQFWAWDPSRQGPEDAFRIATCPLARRFVAHDRATPGVTYPRVLGCFNLRGGSDPQPVQGTDEFLSYNFNFWQYLDVFCFFAGTYDRGPIAPPPRPWVDAGHRNGVKVLGAIFFADQWTDPAEEGQRERPGRRWFRELIDPNRDGAQRLVAIAWQYGFDGWLLNPEVDGGDASLAQDLAAFLYRFQEAKQWDPGLWMIYYDSIVQNGSLRWQGCLNEKNREFFLFSDEKTVVTDAFFADYRGLVSPGDGPRISKANALQGRSLEVFSGIDLAERMYNILPWKYDVDPLLRLIVPDPATPLTSIGLYAPQFTFENSDAGDRCPEPLFSERERLFWGGPAYQVPFSDTPADWKGLSSYVPERSPIASLPFATTFNTGKGKRYASRGFVLREGEWYDMGAQDVPPTWQFRSVISDTVVASFDYDDPYSGGSSLAFAGELPPETAAAFRIFATDLRFDSGQQVVVNIAFKRGLGSGSIASTLQFYEDESISRGFAVPFGSGAPAGEWVTQAFPVSPRRITGIGLKLERLPGDTVGEVDFHLGRVVIHDANAPPPALPTSIRVDRATISADGLSGSLMLSWQQATSPPVLFTEIVKLSTSNEKVEFLGRAHGNRFAIARLTRPDTSASTVLRLSPFGLDHSQGMSPGFVDFPFDWLPR